MVRRFPIAPALALVLACAPFAAAFAQQDGQMMRAPLPPQRPFDLDLPGSPALPPIIVPPPSQAADAPTPAANAPMASEPDEDQGPEWPQLTPGQKAGAEPAFDPNEKPDRPGISTDPGTSIACLPQRLKLILNKISDKYGAVKVTSTWRPPWRARRGSYHKRCEAMDFRVPGVRPRTVIEWVRTLPEVGGHKVYWNGILHVDTGPRRPW
ncbi:hypothetical protein ABIE41_003562 [Bosea sp. OAE506]|uniref:YcbK family protein n=1 Tax=Bosea sp. OAE506 TaxID=2663870 RepID=UPI001789A220